MKLAETIHSMEQAVTIDLKPQLMRLPLSHAGCRFV